MSQLNENKDRAPQEGGRNGGLRGRGKSGKPQNKGVDNATGRGEGRARKVKEHLTIPVWLELELSSQDPLILWNPVKATHTIVKQDSDQLTLFAAEAAYNNIKAGRTTF